MATLADVPLVDADRIYPYDAVCILIPNTPKSSHAILCDPDASAAAFYRARTRIVAILRRPRILQSFIFRVVFRTNFGEGDLDWRGSLPSMELEEPYGVGVL